VTAVMLIIVDSLVSNLKKAGRVTYN